MKKEQSIYTVPLFILLTLISIQTSMAQTSHYHAGPGSGSNDTGVGNTMVGYSAGPNTSTGFSNTFLGSYAGANHTTSDDNTTVGYRSGYGLTRGISNVMIGTRAGSGSAGVVGNQNVFIGSEAASDLSTTINSSVVIGFFAGSLMRGDNNLLMGKFSGQQMQGNENIYFGLQAGLIAKGNNNIMIGQHSGELSEGDDNIFVGFNAGLSNKGTKNIFIGKLAGTRTTGSLNTMVGNGAGSANTTGARNSFFGDDVGKSNTTGRNNAFFGNESGLLNTTASNNAFFGNTAGRLNVSGGDNTFIGHAAGYNNTSGQRNAFVGSQAGGLNQSGSYNVYLGDEAGTLNQTGGANTFVGSRSGYSNTGSYNVFIGRTAGENNTGHRNVFIGYGAGFNEAASDRLIINNKQTGTPLIYGNFALNRLAINKTNPLATLDVNGGIRSVTSISIQNFNISDERFKTEVRSLDTDMEKLTMLRGVSYEFVKDLGDDYAFPEGRHTGFIAQEVKEIFPEMVTEDDNGYLSVNYTAIIPLLVEAVKDLSAKVKDLEKTEKTSTARIDEPVFEASTSAQLHQNRPNPFSEKTMIEYSITRETGSATLFIYDLQGRQLKRYDLTERTGQIEIAGHTLQPGLYHYALVMDGKIVDVKKMILTE